MNKDDQIQLMMCIKEVYKKKDYILSNPEHWKAAKEEVYRLFNFIDELKGELK